MILFLLGIALASDPIPRPAPPERVPGECEKMYPINLGQPLPDIFRNSPSVAACSAVVVPLSDYADLLTTEKWGEAVAQMYSIDTASLEMERDWYKDKLKEQSEPIPFLERPSTQRWFGRIETLVTVGVVAVGLGAAYQYGSGGTK
tara:strand:+ start:2113 stop:2550 length:438 start_codon:yes stop_codon:yes gene_type:complete